MIHTKLEALDVIGDALDASLNHYEILTGDAGQMVSEKDEVLIITAGNLLGELIKEAKNCPINQHAEKVIKARREQ